MDTAITPPGAAMWTTTTLVLIAIGIVCACAVIWWGAAMRRRQKKAIAESDAHAELAGHPVGPEAADLDPPKQAEASPPPAPAIAPAQAAMATAPVASPDSAGGTLTQLKGLGPRAAAQLASLGIDRIDQLAALTPAEVNTLDAQMGALAGRIARDRWIEQAKLLSAGDKAGFEAAFGKLG